MPSGNPAAAHGGNLLLKQITSSNTIIGKHCADKWTQISHSSFAKRNSISAAKKIDVSEFQNVKPLKPFQNLKPLCA
jgi:hypothetical protein